MGIDKEKEINVGDLLIIEDEEYPDDFLIGYIFKIYFKYRNNNPTVLVKWYFNGSEPYDQTLTMLYIKDSIIKKRMNHQKRHGKEV